MAMEFTKEIARLIKPKAGNVEVPVIVEMTKDGLTFKKKGKRKAITVTWEKLLSAPDLLVATKDCPALLQKEQAKIKENPLAFLLEA